MGGSASKFDDRTVFVIGAGTAGTAVARKLDESFNVVVFEPRERMVLTIAQPRATIDARWGERTLVPYDHLLKRGEIRHDNVLAIHPDRIEIEGKDPVPVRATDFVVIATGSHTPSPGRPSGRTTEEMLASQTEAAAALAASRRVLVVGGGPIGCEYAGEVAAAFPDKSVTLVHRGPWLCSSKAASHGEISIPERFGAKTKERLEEMGVDVKIKTAAVVPAGADLPSGIVRSPGPVSLSDGSTVEADLAVWVTGARPNNGPFKETMADAVDTAGRLRVAESLLVRGRDNVFALGDCAELNVGKQAYLIPDQAEVVVANIRSLARGASRASLRQYKPGATPAMFMAFGPEKGIGLLPFCGGIMIGDGMVAGAKSKDLFCTKMSKDIGAEPAPIPTGPPS